MTLPPDRGHVTTEHRHQAGKLDTCSTSELVKLIIDDQQTAIEAAASAQEAITCFVEDLVPRIADGGRLFYLGAGTSGRLGVLDASECPPTFNVDPTVINGLIAGGDSALRRSSEAREDDPTGVIDEFESHDLGSKDSVLGIAAGGTTPWVLGGVEEASRRGAMTGLMTCAPLPANARADHHILLDTGAELLTGSTRLKAGTATKIALNAITTSLFIRLGKVHDNLMVDLKATNTKLHDRCLRILCELCPQLDRPAADQMLQQADGDLRVAIVMARTGLGQAECQHRVSECGGDLRRALG